MFDWDAANALHVARHGASPEEVEEALLDPRRTVAGAYGRDGERRSAYIGSTEKERVLFVVTTARRRRVRVVTARDATDRERRWHRQRRPEEE